MKKVLWIDVETTGLDCKKCAIVQLSCMVEIDGEIKGVFDETIAPHRTADIQDSALKVVGKTKEELMEYPKANVQYTKFIKFLNQFIDRYDKHDKLIVAGYNVQFDIDFISAFFHRHGDAYLGSYIYRSFFDVLHLVGALRYKGVIPKEDLATTKLQDVADYFGLTDYAFHNSLDDIMATRELAIALLEEL
jgi:DNA polymerase-3 subunit epsilon